ncbi:uncharacterized protein LOC122263775 [Penaeus japonicus]|uniref:uncharacterized protein LOC122263775 n=1 Tax=Penaeus japonicus TaxID=27405 RepID=UPI001C7124A4|nr:uncharacterized protein LOC122263775 [Penaeus japonicus]XP_042888312.1 uncharacterized protein LOC122263775 [Penaeus japonicus]XP_042888313.1 uncharacterized protein LOC122263775 [Penaeus japonicus]XP_042888314.1 uncharacterized protein LOC122263775 [Penaeus japonicus]
MVAEVEIKPEVVEQYQRDGAVLIKGVFSPSWVNKVRDGIKKNLEKPSKYAERLVAKEGEGAYFDDYCNWSWIEEFCDYVFNSPAASLVASCLKSSEVSFYHEHVLNKEPGTSKRTPWHHDQAYYPIDGEKVCSLWMPVDHVPRQTCVQFVAGSHLWPSWFHPRKFESERNYEIKETKEGDDEKLEKRFVDIPVQEIEAGKWPLLQWECEPGDVIVFHMKTVHGAPGNTSVANHRRVLSTRWLGDDAVLATRPWEVSPPITGGLKPGQRAVCDTFPLVYTKPRIQAT